MVAIWARLERARGVTRDLDLDRPDVGQHGLGPASVAGVAAAPADCIVLVIAQVIGDLAFQGRFQDPLGQLLQQPTLPGQLQPSDRARSTSIATSCSSDTGAGCPGWALWTGSTVFNSTAVSVT
jgi:hypothetical protein